MPDLILLVDDEPSIIQLSRLYLERDGFKVETAGDGEMALEATARLRPGLMVLDVMLLKVDGFEVCRRLRAENNPILIIMLTARDEDIDKIIGLELGADDYLTKPFNPRELAARIKALLRRNERKLNLESTLIQIADVSIDPAAREVRVGNSLVAMRAQEFDLLHVFAENRGKVLSREKLLELAWGFDYFGQTRTVDVHVGHLRRKLSGSSIRIETVAGVGYKLVKLTSNP
jgi:two-component system, OmpR family, alkaline phosphatase synthesis response regulator PhoP